QELKTDDTKFPARAIHEAGYGAIWHGQRAHHGVAILAKDESPKELRRGLAGEPSDNQSRYLEAEAKGLVIASIYLPNGNPVGSRLDGRGKATPPCRAHVHVLGKRQCVPPEQRHEARFPVAQCAAAGGSDCGGCGYRVPRTREAERSHSYVGCAALSCGSFQITRHDAQQSGRCRLLRAEARTIER